MNLSREFATEPPIRFESLSSKRFVMSLFNSHERWFETEQALTLRSSYEAGLNTSASFEATNRDEKQAKIYSREIEHPQVR
jgi:hypothetical protein